MIETHAQRATLIAALTELYEVGREQLWPAAERASEAIAGFPTMDMLDPDTFRDRLREIIR